MKRILIILFVLCLSVANAQTAKQIDFLTNGIHDANGAPIQGGKAYFYEAGHLGDPSFYKTVWNDAYKGSVAANPYTLSSIGGATVFGDGFYDILVKDADLTTIIQVLSGVYVVESSAIVSGNAAAYEEYTLTTALTNPTITLANPYRNGSRQIQVYVDGSRQYPYEYTELSATRIKITGVLAAGTRVHFYNLGVTGTSSGAAINYDYATATSLLTDAVISLPLATYTPNVKALTVWLDGIRQYPQEVAETSATQAQVLGDIASGTSIMFEIFR